VDCSPVEYDLEIKPTKLIKGQGLSQMMTQSNFELLGVNFIVDLSQGVEEEVPPQVSQNSWIHLGTMTLSLFYKTCKLLLN
jgi:hypothetical protein